MPSSISPGPDRALVASRQWAVEQAILALDAARSSNMARLREHAAALLAVASADPGPRASAPALRRPDRLTDREAEILGLLADGATNAAIAETLFLSPGTVHWYTVKIYQKLGVRGRAEAAAYAVRHDLAARQERTALPGMGV